MSHLWSWQLNLFKPQSPHLQKEKENTYLTGLLWELNEMMFIKYSAQWVTFEKHSLYHSSSMINADLWRHWNPLHNFNAGITYMPILWNLRFFSYFEWKEFISYLHFNNKSSVRSRKYLTPYSGSGIIPNDIIFPMSPWRKSFYYAISSNLLYKRWKSFFSLILIRNGFNHW